MNEKWTFIIIIVFIGIIIGGAIAYFILPKSSLNIFKMQQQLSYGLVDPWIVKDNTVYINDSKAYISATPHTLNKNNTICMDFPNCNLKRGEVDFIIKSKVYTGDVDVVIGVNTTQFKLKDAKYYNPHNKTYSYTCPTEFFNYTSDYFWCYENRTYIENITEENKSKLFLIKKGHYEWGNVATKTAYWNVTEDWKDVPGKVHSINYNYGGMNKWFYKKNLPIVSGKTYNLRAEFEVNLNEIDDKYWFAIKPSSETLQEAIDNNHLYALDPWINSSGDDQNMDYLDDDLIAYWKFDDESGSVAKAEVNESYNITGIGSGTWNKTDGVVGGSYTPSSEQPEPGIDFKNHDFWDGDKLTINIWINQTASASGIAMFSRGSTSTDGDFDLALYDTAEITWNAKDSANQRKEVVVNQQTNGKWQMITCLLNSTDICLYHNGTYIGCTGFSGTFDFDSSTEHFEFWTRDSSGSYYWDKPFDEAGIWNRTLNSSEILDLYEKRATYNETGAPADDEYPVFSSYYDDNASLVDSGDGHFNVTVTSTNGTVYLEID
ncbi:hypothetical protein GF386_05445, partial [Candidatus Pacearchaeota archaeon]|nr:hypothetical protein [Candidatus Pacearchaeota archaeon]MBD3283535.1 hypothetical protein [Candidatus Pacearchaeota archaeon]